MMQHEMSNHILYDYVTISDSGCQSDSDLVEAYLTYTTYTTYMVCTRHFDNVISTDMFADLLSQTINMVNVNG